jgi:hypothetical protein
MRPSRFTLPINAETKMGASCSAENVSEAKGLEVVSYIPEHEEEDQQVVHHVVEEAFEHVVSQQGEKL